MAQNTSALPDLTGRERARCVDNFGKLIDARERVHRILLDHAEAIIDGTGSANREKAPAHLSLNLVTFFIALLPDQAVDL